MKRLTFAGFLGAWSRARFDVAQEQRLDVRIRIHHERVAVPRQTFSHVAIVASPGDSIRSEA